MSGLTTQLAALAGDPVRVGWPLVERAIDRLAALVDTAVPEDLERWGVQLRVGDGAVPLLGMSGRAATCPGLLWSGARLHRSGLGRLEGLLLLAAVTCDPDASADDLARGIGAGLAVEAALRSATAEDALALPTTGVVAAATCLSAARRDDAELTSQVVELAGALMVVQPAGDDEEPGEVEPSLRAGHELAAGWLAWQLSATGIASTADAVEDTLATVTGRPLRAVDGQQPVRPTAAPAHLTVADVVRRLT